MVINVTASNIVYIDIVRGSIACHGLCVFLGIFTMQLSKEKLSVVISIKLAKTHFTSIELSSLVTLYYL